MFKIKCLVCGKTKETRKRHGKYCSRGCYLFYRKNILIGEKHHNWSGGKIERICEVCGKKFLTGRARVANGFGRFCGRKCWGVVFGKSLVREKNHNWVGRVISQCLWCGKNIEISITKKNRGLGKYCSHLCRCLSHNKTMIGPKHNSWKGGVCKKTYRIRRSSEYREWREKVFSRDSYRCVKCGDNDHKLNAHHIVRFSVILEEIKKEKGDINLGETMRSSDKLWDINNGITLCQKCHKEEHKNEKYINKIIS